MVRLTSTPAQFGKAADKLAQAQREIVSAMAELSREDGDELYYGTPKMVQARKCLEDFEKEFRRRAKGAIEKM